MKANEAPEKIGYFQQGKAFVINKACEWLQRNIDSSMWLANFRKHLEE